MKAIIKVSKNSSFAKFNGHTFEVKEVLSTNSTNPIFAMDINGSTTDFTSKEIIIVDLVSELNKSLAAPVKFALSCYVKINKISL
jgi:hypothetical protein